MKRISFLALVLVLSGDAAPRQDLSDVFYKAVHLQDVKGDLEAAIPLFEKVVSESKDPSLAAKAQLRIGMCYEKLGLRKAQAAYQRVIDSYPQQHQEVALARERIAALAGPSPTTITLRQVWAGPDADTSGRPSPDGKYLSYIDWGTGDLAVLDLATGEKRRLTTQTFFKADSYAYSPVWSPDGKDLAYLWGDRQLRIIGLDGSPPRLVSEQTGVPVAWFPDGSDLWTVAKRDEDLRRFYRIERVALSDGRVRVLRAFDLPMNDHRPNVSLSPDGRYIAFDYVTEHNSKRLDIFVIAADGTQQRALIAHPADDRLLGWAPDGRSILFSSDRTGDRDAWILPMVDGNPAGPPGLVKKEIGEITPLGFTRSGAYFYGRRITGHDVHTARMDPGSGKLLGPPERATENWPGGTMLPEWSPDGLSLAYATVRRYGPASESKIFIRSLSNGLERELPTPVARIENGPKWSPDGRSLLVVGENTPTDCGGFLVDVETGKATRVIDLGKTEINPRAVWAPDGKTIFYSVRDFPTQTGRIVRLDVRSGGATTLWSYAHFLNPIDVAVSPDGNQLAFTLTFTKVDGREQPHFLMSIPTAGGEAREIASIDRPNIIVATTLVWTRDGRHVMFEKFLDATAAKPGLWRVTATGGAPEQVMEFANPISDLSLHPDGRRIAFTAGGGHEEVWVMENFLPAPKEGAPASAQKTKK
jgi:Tol biopolymer transport system component